jgi:xylulose-5-phosphate/fructose-6-phosphate phosphoketolase
MTPTINQDRLAALQKYWRAANYLGAAQLYLAANALLLEELKPEHLKRRFLGHWGTQPSQNLIYAHLNRLIQDTDASLLLVVGPGHGAPAILANLYLEGTLGEVYPELAQSPAGINLLVRQFSWPYGAPSHLVPATPGMVNVGGELGYCLVHAYGAVLDNPELIAVCIVGDGEAETGPLAGSWHSNKFLNPARDGAVLPILDLNGYKLSGPTIFGRMSDLDLANLFQGYGYQVRIVSGDHPDRVHPAMWEALDWAYGEIRKLQDEARNGRTVVSPAMPMLVLRTPKGWTCPKTIDGKPVENTFHSHQIPVMNVLENPAHFRILVDWLKSYGPEELFDKEGRPIPEVTSIVPRQERRMGLNPHANGGALQKPLELPDYTKYAVAVPTPGAVKAEGTRELSKYLRDVFRANAASKNFRFFCPDETTSNRMDHIFEATERVFMWPLVDTDEFLSRDGRVMEILSEHCCQGWLEGYLLTGRHGILACYEAFIPIVDSMLNQYAKWIREAQDAPWRKPLACLNYLLTSHVWRQDHNGYSHQVPSFLNTVASKKGSVARIYLPPDANCLLRTMEHCLRRHNYVNLIVASKQMIPQWLDMKAADEHFVQGASIWEWAGNGGDDPDVVMACAGDVPTEETVAAAWWLRQFIPELRVRVVNIIDLLTLMSRRDHPHGLDERNFIKLFTEDKPVIFAFHGYPRLIHELNYHNPNPQRFHVHGYMEEGRTTTPFDMLVLNQMSRYHLAIAALERVDRLRTKAGDLIDRFTEKLTAHRVYIRDHDEDMPEVLDWQWTAP